MTTPSQKLKGLARSSAAPVRNYFNAHFEMTKDEVRRAVGEAGVAAADLAQNGGEIAELANVVAETQLYQSRLIGELRREIAALRADVELLTANTARIAEVLAAATVQDDVVE